MVKIRVFDVLFCLTAVAWGSVIGLPRNIFEPLQSRQPGFGYFPDWAFGLLMIIAGITILLSRKLRYRQICSLILVVMFGFVVFLAFISGINEVSLLIGIPFLSLSLYFVIRYFQISQDIKVLQEMQ